jgi:hypothetical protein
MRPLPPPPSSFSSHAPFESTNVFNNENGHHRSLTKHNPVSLDKSSRKLKGLALVAREVRRIGVDAIEELEGVVNGASPPAYIDKKHPKVSSLISLSLSIFLVLCFSHITPRVSQAELSRFIYR